MKNYKSTRKLQTPNLLVMVVGSMVALGDRPLRLLHVHQVEMAQRLPQQKMMCFAAVRRLSGIAVRAKLKQCQLTFRGIRKNLLAVCLRFEWAT
jgi:hypothetical protein